MKKIEICVDIGIDLKEIAKTIGFISEKISSVEVKDNIIFLEIPLDMEKEIREKVTYYLQEFVTVSEKKVVKYQKNEARKYYSDEIYYTYSSAEGSVSFVGNAFFLYKYFDEMFLSFCEKIKNANFIEKLYPVLLPIEEYIKTGYLNTSPQYAIFCAPVEEDFSILKDVNKAINEINLKGILKEPKVALSPSACFHVYPEYKNRTLIKPELISFTQNVFRNEGRFNFQEFGRLRDYHVREIVFIGDNEFVYSTRDEILKQSINFIKELNLNADVTNSSDCFVMPKMQKYKNIQLMESSKYEMHINYEEKKQLSVASFNYHGTSFTYPFNIEMVDCQETVTGCIGFGLERWVLAFLSQYGNDVEKWPNMIKEEYYNEKH